MIPYTSTLFLENSDLAEDTENISFEPLTEFTDIVCRTAGVRTNPKGVGLYYISLNNLIKYVRESRKDPITRDTINWKNYETVMLNVNESLEEKIKRLDNYYATETKLQSLQNVRFALTDKGRFWKYQAFRYLIKNLVDAHPVREDLGWLYDYWLYFGYDENKDLPEIEFIHQILDHEEFHKYHAAENKEEFIIQMQTIFNRPTCKHDVWELYKFFLEYHTEFRQRTLSEENATDYQEFRFRMKELAEDPQQSIVTIYNMTEYWKYYGYNPEKDDRRLENVRLDQKIVKRLQHCNKFRLRSAMTSEINNIHRHDMNIFPDHDKVIHNFWKYHPILEDEPELLRK
jgi:hypothetical protein